MMQRVLFGGAVAFVVMVSASAFLDHQSVARGASPATQPESAKYGFFIYGNFDGERAGQIDPARPERLAQLVRQYGGRVMDRVNINTDFVVLGKEPVLRKLTPDEANDPVLWAEYTIAMQKLAEYKSVREQAHDFGVPVLTQAQFLVLCGAVERVNQ